MELVGIAAINQPNQEGIVNLWNVQNRLSIIIESGYIHPDRMNQINNSIKGNCSSKDSDSDPGWAAPVKEERKEFLNKSQKERKKIYKGKTDPLSHTKSGKMPARP